MLKKILWKSNWNNPVIDMYRKSGAKIDNEWSNCDLNSKGIKEFNF